MLKYTCNLLPVLWLATLGLLQTASVTNFTLPTVKAASELIFGSPADASIHSNLSNNPHLQSLHLNIPVMVHRKFFFVHYLCFMCK